MGGDTLAPLAPIAASAKVIQAAIYVQVQMTNEAAEKEERHRSA